MATRRRPPLPPLLHRTLRSKKIFKKNGKDVKMCSLSVDLNKKCKNIIILPQVSPYSCSSSRKANVPCTPSRACGTATSWALSTTPCSRKKIKIYIKSDFDIPKTYLFRIKFVFFRRNIVLQLITRYLMWHSMPSFKMLHMPLIIQHAKHNIHQNLCKV